MLKSPQRFTKNMMGGVGSWSMYMYKNQTNKAKNETYTLSHTHSLFM